MRKKNRGYGTFYFVHCTPSILKRIIISTGFALEVDKLIVSPESIQERDKVQFHFQNFPSIIPICKL